MKYSILSDEVAMYPDAPYFTISLCVMPGNFTLQGEGIVNQWVNQTISQCTFSTS